MKFRLKVIGLFLSVLLVPSSIAEAQSNTWDVVKDQSFILFAGTQTGNAFEGRFENFEVAIDFDPDEPANARVRATINAASAVTGDNQRDEALPEKAWFNVVEFPQIVFLAEGFEKVGPSEFTTNGILTVLGVEHKLPFPFRLDLVDNSARMNAELTLNRQQLGIGSGPWAEGKWVGLDVNVQIQIEAVRAEP